MNTFKLSAPFAYFLFKPLGVAIRAIVFLLEFAFYWTFATNRAAILRANVSNVHTAICNCRFSRSH